MSPVSTRKSGASDEHVGGHNCVWLLNFSKKLFKNLKDTCPAERYQQCSRNVTSGRAEAKEIQDNGVKQVRKQMRTKLKCLNALDVGRALKACSALAMIIAIGGASAAVDAKGIVRTDVVPTSLGPIRGLVQNKMDVFLGIPYGAPPIGDLRWRPPVFHAKWKKTIDTVAYGNVCAQNNKTYPGFGYFSNSEDCLFLNVYTPSNLKPWQKLPVMVWIPGGGLFIGASNDYDPSSLVNDGNVVYVSMNYRLNVFGFFSHPAINAEGHAAGNYGIMDQQLALKWVKENIAKFGGNPNNVTIFGESAGGISVWANIASPRSTGYFHKAIAESGTGTPNALTPTLQSQESIGKGLASATGCTTQTAECLRSLSAQAILDANLAPPGTLASGNFNTGIMADGTIIPEPMRNAIAAGRFNRVPLINGTNHDEYDWFQAMLEITTGHVITAAEYPDRVAAQWGAIAPQVLKLYPLTNYASPSNALAAAVGDNAFVCNGNRRSNRAISRFVKNVYGYEFDVPNSPSPWPVVSFPYLSAHTIEIQYLFPLFHGGSGTPHELNSSQKHLAKQMVQYWTTFARTGTPNATDRKSPPSIWPASYSPHGSSLPTWYRFDQAADNVLSLRLPRPITLTSFGDRHNCDFWDSQFK